MAAVALSMVACGGQSRSSYQGPVDRSATVERDLTWRPPAVGQVHYPRRQARNYLPGRADSATYHKGEQHIDQRSRAGRHRLPVYPGH
ncbi:MAG: hypothetical protein EA401_01620 [Planctomycetota bacterium]|nr:MAG: hypothetical protein EA401_01620 [Planctomycetota bacterium]